MDGWGSADAGGAYTLEGLAADFDVPSTVGTIRTSVGNVRTASLTAVSAQDVDATVRVQVDKAATGGGHMVYLVARRTSASTLYLGRLRFLADGSVRLQVFKLVNGTATAIGTEKAVTGLTYTASSMIQLRMQVTGTNSTTLKLKAWAAGQAEPTTWLVSVTDSEPSLQTAGAVGVRTYVSSTSTNAPITFTFDDFRVTNPVTP